MCVLLDQTKKSNNGIAEKVSEPCWKADLAYEPWYMKRYGVNIKLRCCVQADLHAMQDKDLVTPESGTAKFNSVSSSNVRP